MSQAIQKAAKRLEPEVQTVSLEKVTLRTEADLEAWLTGRRSACWMP